MGRKRVRIGNLSLGGRDMPFILGPCVMETPAFTRRMAKKIHAICRDLEVPWIFKASFDKANRTSVNSFRGPGIEDGCKLLAELGAEFGVPVTTDIHTVEQAAQAAPYIDLLQIPAFLCRQTDLILAAGATGRAVNVKKGQFLAPWDVKNIAVKLASVGCVNACFTERGTTFGYNNLVADMRAIPWMQELGCSVIFDATHSVQRPGGGGDTTSGDGQLAPVLARAAVASGCDAVFIETHENPSRALSDGPNQIPLRQLPALLRQLRAIREIVV
jgi:2-dehydro-3-deoxyphosphooctonate aldolase (KDO 8-P synthase)